MNKKYLLILNNGSSSLKFALFELKKKILGREILAGSVTGNSQQSVLHYYLKGKLKKINYSEPHDLKNAWQYIYSLVEEYNVGYVGFRMVHGGEEFVKTARVNKQFIRKIVKYNKLAPLHNPWTVELMKLVKLYLPKVKVAASFDTAWYQNLEPEAYLYSLPLKYYEQYQIRKYGFHGLSHEMATKYAAKRLNRKLNKLAVITCHLGSGGSITLFERGKVKDTTMGFSPNEGLTMATRSGDLPASIVFYLGSELKMSNNQIKNLLNKEAGLFGLSGMSDLREILRAAGYRVTNYKSKKKFSIQQKKVARLALAVYIYDIKRYLASYISLSKKLEAIVFTGAVGVNSSVIRKLALKDLAVPNKCKILIAPEGEIINLVDKTIKCLISK